MKQCFINISIVNDDIGSNVKSVLIKNGKKKKKNEFQKIKYGWHFILGEAICRKDATMKSTEHINIMGENE